MIPYANLAGNSGVLGYEFGDDFINVEFVDGSVYSYTSESIGQEVIDGMKQLAENGNGLSTFISRYAKNYFHKKIK